MQKLDNHNFVHYLTSHDFLCLTETFIADEFKSDLFDDYLVFNAKARKLSHQGRYSGGVIVLVRKKFGSYVEQIYTEFDNVIVLKMKKELFGTPKDIMYICLYIPPHDSSYWQYCHQSYGIEIIEQCVLDLNDTYDDFHLLLCGDLNARTASENTKSIDDDLDDMLSVSFSQFPRNSQDTTINNFGEQLLEFCSMFDCTILNGICEDGFDGSCTYIASSGASVVDYYIMSYDLYSLSHIESLLVGNQTESDHLPVVLTSVIKDTCEDIHLKQKEKNTKRCVEKIIWDSAKEQDFIKEMKSGESRRKLETATGDIENDINRALSLFIDCIQSASKCMTKKCYEGLKPQKAEWFDEECKGAKSESRQKLKIFRSTRSEEDRQQYVQARKKYKKLLTVKKSKFKKEKMDFLNSQFGNSATFWKELKNMGLGKRKNNTITNIDIKEWYEYFKDLFQDNSDSEDINAGFHSDPSEEDHHVLNSDISKDEVRAAIKKLKVGKSCGIDGISAEMLKAGGDDTVSFLTKFFNVLFSKGVYPEIWAKAIIVPIHKKGDTNKTDNYRGVSLLSIISKCYTTIFKFETLQLVGRQ